MVTLLMKKDLAISASSLLVALITIAEGSNSYAESILLPDAVSPVLETVPVFKPEQKKKKSPLQKTKSKNHSGCSLYW